MKKLTTLLIALVFASLIIFMSCGGTDDTPPQPSNGETIAKLMADGTWNAPAVVNNGNSENVSSDWANFKLNFTVSGSNKLTGSYTSEGLPRTEFTDVWAAQGTWTIDEAGTTITRNDGVTWTISGISASATTTLTLVSSAITQSGREAGIDGSWTFTFR